MEDSSGGDYNYYAFNNLFRFGTLYVNSSGSIPWIFRDNLFDRSSVGGCNTITNDYNGYVTNQNRLIPNGAHDKILTNNPAYLTSYLGNYYYPTNDGMLSTLTNAGSRTASSATLYHYTCWTNQQKEASSTVDIGFHYVACDSSGNPIDTDGDGIPDYLEDTNGNGSVDSGETDWTTYNSPNGLASGSGLQVFTPLK